MQHADIVKNFLFYNEKSLEVFLKLPKIIYVTKICQKVCNLVELFRQIVYYLVELFHQITHYLTEQFSQIAHYLVELCDLDNFW